MRYLSCCAVVSVVITILAGCGSGGNEKTCQAMCEKSVACNPEATLEDCLHDCEAADVFQDAFWTETKKCMDASCTEMDGCLQAALTKCVAPANLSDFVDLVCEKNVDCQPTITLEMCQTLMVPMIEVIGKCLVSDFIDQAVTCLGPLDNCETFADDSEACLEY